jgi:hypothetical protein
MYRRDQEAASSYTGKKGHKSEFISCFETGQLIAVTEAEQCQETGKLVRPGILVKCEATGKRVLPSECGRCSVSNKVVLRRMLVSSSISQTPVLPDFAIRSSAGKFCLPAEGHSCTWSGQYYHPDDLGRCTLTNLPICTEFLTKQHSRLRPLFDLLNDVN